MNRLPVLEFGKLTDPDTGAPVPGAEPRALAASDGFPASLVSACRLAGVVAGPTIGQYSGWTLRRGHRLVRIAARATLLPERAGTSRPMARARFIADVDVRWPLAALFGALAEDPLRPWSGADAPASPLVRIPRAASTDATRGAAAVLAAGHALYVIGAQAPSLGWLAAVEAALPARLAPLFSVGTVDGVAIRHGPESAAPTGARDGPEPGVLVLPTRPARESTPPLPWSRDADEVLSWPGSEATARRSGIIEGPGLRPFTLQILGREGSRPTDDELSAEPLAVARAFVDGADLPSAFGGARSPHALTALSVLEGDLVDDHVGARLPWRWYQAALHSMVRRG